MDSARAAAIACEVVRELRSRTQADCRVAWVREEADGFQVRVEETTRGGPPLDFPRSTVRIDKDGASVTVTRIPQL